MAAQRYLTILRERWLAALTTALIVMGAVIGATVLQRPEYEATTSIFVRTEAGSSVADRSVAADYARQQISTYSDLVATPLVLDPAIDTLGLPISARQLAGKITATVPEDTLLLTVTARAADPQGAADLANAVSDSLRNQISVLEGPSSVELTVVTPATAPDQPFSPHVGQNIVLGFVAALLAGVLATILRDLLDNKVRKADDIRLLTDAAIMATVPAVNAKNAVTSISERYAQSVQAEAYRELRSNLRFLEMRGRSRSLLVTSSIKGEGKSATAINLAGALARADRRVLLVDADLRDPSVHFYLGLEGSAGLSTVLIGEAELDDVVQPLELENLSVLASGPVPPNPSELLDSDRMTAFLDAATARYDVVILDSPPLLAVTDATAIARRVSGTVFVAGSGKVRRPQLTHALQKLQMVQVKLLGIVLNGVPRNDRSTYPQAYGVAPAETEALPEVPVDRALARRAATNEDPPRRPRPSTRRRATAQDAEPAGRLETVGAPEHALRAPRSEADHGALSERR